MIPNVCGNLDSTFELATINDIERGKYFFASRTVSLIICNGYTSNSQSINGCNSDSISNVGKMSDQKTLLLTSLNLKRS